MEPRDTIATVRLVGPEHVDHSVPLEVLVRTLNGLQALVYIAASDEQDRKVSQRFRLPGNLEQHYQLSCLIPERGSYVVPLTFRVDGQLRLVDEFQPVIDKVYGFLEALLNGRDDELRKYIRESSLARRGLVEARKFLPRAGDLWKVGLTSKTRQSELMLTRKARKNVDKFLTEEFSAETTTTVTGELIAIDFERHKLSLRYPVTNQVIDCLYSEDLEDSMVDNRRGLIQVTGKFTLDAAGRICELRDVTRVAPLDLSPLVLEAVLYAPLQTIRFKQPQVIELSQDEQKQYLLASLEEIGIHAMALTREDLIDDIEAQVRFVWKEYVTAENSCLTQDALELKRQITNRVELQ